MADYFERLNYALGDEDAALEYAILPKRAGHVVGVAGSGGRLLPLLARKPARMTCADISAPQLAFTRLRFALLKQTDHESFMDFMGYRTGTLTTRRQAIFQHLDLPREDRRWLADLFQARRWQAPIYMGAFERTLQRLAKINGLFTGQASSNFSVQPPRRANGLLPNPLSPQTLEGGDCVAWQCSCAQFAALQRCFSSQQPRYQYQGCVSTDFPCLVHYANRAQEFLPANAVFR